MPGDETPQSPEPQLTQQQPAPSTPAPVAPAGGKTNGGGDTPSPLTVVPSSPTLIRGQAQPFEALPKDDQTRWSQAPEAGKKYGTVDAVTGVYVAPKHVFLAKSIVLIATRGQQFATATVTISSSPFWTALLGIFWVISAALLLLAAVYYWPGRTAVDVAPRVSPPAVYLAQNDTQQFMIAGLTANPGVTWALDKPIGTISPGGLYTAPAGPYGAGPAPPKNGEVITVTASDPAKKLQIVSAKVVLTGSPTIAIDPSTATVPSGGKQLFQLRGTPAGVTPQWSVEPQAGIGSISKGMGEYSAPSTISVSKIVTVFANVSGAANAPQGPLTAEAVVILCDTGADGSCADTAAVPAMVIFVFIMGALGSYVHAAASFATFTGNRQLASSWSWWYVLRPLIGGLLAVLGYFLLNGGLTTVTDPSNLYKVAAYSGLIGMFAEQATIKFGDIFDAIFKPSDTQKDKLDTSQPPPPAKLVLTKVSVTPESGKFKVTLTGTGFVAASTAKMNDNAIPVTFVSPTTLTATLDANPAPTDKFTVTNPGPNGPVTSEAKSLS